MPTSGGVDYVTPTLDVYPFDGTTAATLEVRPPAPGVAYPAGSCTATTVQADVDGVPTTVQRWTAPAVATETPAGWWVLAWTVTGTGGGSPEQRIYVPRPPTPAPAITVDPATDIGMIRTLATDLDEDTPLFTDEQITAFLAMEGNVRCAAALALETTAVSEALISKKIRTLDLSTDGPAVAKELRERAAQLRAQEQAIADTTTGAGILPLWSFPEPPTWGDALL